MGRAALGANVTGTHKSDLPTAAQPCGVPLVHVQRGLPCPAAGSLHLSARGCGLLRDLNPLRPSAQMRSRPCPLQKGPPTADTPAQRAVPPISPEAALRERSGAPPLPLVLVNPPFPPDRPVFQTWVQCRETSPSSSLEPLLGQIKETKQQ